MQVMANPNGPTAWPATALLVVVGAGLNAFGVVRVYVALAKTRPPFEGWGWVCQAAGWALILWGSLGRYCARRAHRTPMLI
jgi:hypothetical protein